MCSQGQILIVKMEFESCSGLNSFRKLSEPYMNEFPKVPAYSIKNPRIIVQNSAAFGILFMWLLAAFRNLFMTELVSFGKISRNKKGFL